MSLRITSSSWPGLKWDDGVEWRTVIVQPAEDLALEVEYVREKVLKTSAGDIEDDVIEQYIRTATEACEEATRTAVMRQRRRILLSGVPAARVVIPNPPFVRVVSVGYLDADGDAQAWGGSPLPYRVIPSGPYRRAELIPAAGETFPSVYTSPDAFSITFDCGYDDAADVPSRLKTGIGLMVGELYKQRSLSVYGINSHPSQLDLSRFWRPVY